MTAIEWNMSAPIFCCWCYYIRKKHKYHKEKNKFWWRL